MSVAIREAVRWSLAEAESEFPLGRDTMAKRLTLLGENPDTDGKFTTRQICAAVYGDREMEKARLAKEQADRIMLDNEERRRNLIPVADALVIARRFCFAIRQKILASGMSDDEKNVVLGEIKRLAEADLTTFPDEESAT